MCVCIPDMVSFQIVARLWCTKNVPFPETTCLRDSLQSRHNSAGVFTTTYPCRSTRVEMCSFAVISLIVSFLGNIYLRKCSSVIYHLRTCSRSVLCAVFPNFPDFLRDIHKSRFLYVGGSVRRFFRRRTVRCEKKC